MTHFLRITSCVVAIAASAVSASAGPLQRYTLIVGANSGGPDRPQLRYAVADAERVAQVLVDLGGVERDQEIVLRNPSVRDFMDALAQLNARVSSGRRAAVQAGGRVEILFYYSGHADEKGLLLGEDRVSYQSLRDRLDEIPADVRIAVLDACASGAFTRAKGGRKRPPFVVSQSANMQGHAFLTSSSATEAAQESDRLGASYFTHYLVSGFRGAADASGDGQVTLNEAYQFAFAETVGRTAETRGGAQHPSYDINLTGAGDVVMTDMRQTTATLVLEAELEGRVFVRAAASRLPVAELYKARGRKVELAVEAGAYDVRVEVDRRARAARVQLVDGARAAVAPHQLGTATIEATRSRGQTDESPFMVAGRSRISFLVGGWGDNGGVRFAGRDFDIVSGGQYTKYIREDLAVTLGWQGFGVESYEGIIGGFASPLALRWNPVRGNLAAQRIKPYLSAGIVPVTQLASSAYAFGYQLGAGTDVHFRRSFTAGVGVNYNGFPLTGRNPRHDDFKGLEVTFGIGWLFGSNKAIP